MGMHKVYMIPVFSDSTILVDSLSRDLLCGLQSISVTECPFSERWDVALRNTVINYDIRRHRILRAVVYKVLVMDISVYYHFVAFKADDAMIPFKTMKYCSYSHYFSDMFCAQLGGIKVCDTAQEGAA